MVLTLIVWKLRQNLSLRKRIFQRILLFIFLACASATKITGFLAIGPLAVYLLANRQRREFLWLIGAGFFALVFKAWK